MASLRGTLNLKTEILGGAQTHFIKSQMNLEWPFKTKLEMGRRPFLNGGTNQGADKRDRRREEEEKEKRKGGGINNIKIYSKEDFPEWRREGKEEMNK